MNSDSVNDANWPSEKIATKSRSSEVATVLIAASKENSRMKVCDRDRNGTSSNSDARKTYQIIEPMSPMLCGMPGRLLDAPSAAVSSSQVTAVTMPKRRSTIANGCRSRWYDQLNSAIDAMPSAATPPCVHHQAPASQAESSATASANAKVQAPSEIQRPPGSRRGYTHAALTIAAAVMRS